jgi:ornithine cyclodeaminase
VSASAPLARPIDPNDTAHAITEGAPVQFIGREDVAAALPWSALILAIESTLTSPLAEAPDRTVHSVTVGRGKSDASLLLKPGWVIGDVIAVKVVTFFPENGSLGLPTVNAGVLLFDGANGTLLGACDGNELTARRTAAASAVAAKRLLVIGTGALAPMTALAHASVRDYELIDVWGRDVAKAEAVVDELRNAGLDARVSTDLDTSVPEADVISAVTAATSPLIQGALLGEGTHVDLIGSFTPSMRESDDDVIKRASVWVDSRSDGLLAGDLAQPIADGLLAESDIKGDLVDLITGTGVGRRNNEEITVFKSAGLALEDVAAARLVFAGTEGSTQRR